MKEYKSRMCPNCVNEVCRNNIVTVIKGAITITKCNDYIARKTDNKKYLDKYINEIKLRGIIRNDS